MGTITSSVEVSDHCAQPLFSFRDVSVCYGTMSALSGFSGEITKGSMLAILGPNGGGKSTLLKLMMGQLRASGGEMGLAIPRRGIAYMPQMSDVDRTFPLTVRDVVAAGLFNRVGFYRGFGSDHLALVAQAMEETGITALADRALDALSGGQFQRVLFARLLLQQCDVMLLDEPFSGVDAYTVEDLMHLLKRWHQQGKTLIIVTHDLDLVREHFPQTLILARHPVAWGRTEETLTLDNLRMAKALSRQWSQDPRNYAAHPQMTM